MSSLRSLCRKGKCRGLNGASVEFAEAFLRHSKNHEVIGVDATSVAKDIVVSANDGGWLIPDRVLSAPSVPTTPPFRDMWFEFSFNGDRWAVVTQRLDGTHLPTLRKSCNELRGSVADKWTVMGLVGIPMDGWLVPLPMRNLAYIGEDGIVNATGLYAEDVALKFPEVKQMIASQMSIGVFVTAHACSRLNCKNVELREIAGQYRKERRDGKPISACVWHEISVSSVPNIRQAEGSRGCSVSDEDKRAYWIRGHYADYRKGNGLFGNPKLKCVFWIPEHKRGNEDLGEIVPEYLVK